MRVPAKRLQLINIGQLVEVSLGGVVTMGKLERVRKHDTAMVSLRISGDSVTVPEGMSVNIKRSSEAHELHLASLGVEDLVDHAGVGA